MSIFCPSSQVCEACDGNGHHTWIRKGHPIKFLACHPCHGRGVHGWAGPSETHIHKFKLKKRARS